MKMYLAIALLLVLPSQAQAQNPLDFSRINGLASRAREVVDVTIDSALLQMASGFLSGDKPDDAAIKNLVAGLKGVYVKSFEFDQEGQYSEADVESVRAQLKSPWTRIVDVDSKQDGEHVEVYILREGDQPGGLAVLAAEPRQLTIVNILGRIDLSQLAGLKGLLGIPAALGALPGATSQPTPPSPPSPPK
jgi:hypothetical protein